MPAIVFDFDGTLTYDSPNIWKRLWKDLGYSTGTGSYFSCLFIQFMLGKINHKEWCDLSCEEFMKKGHSFKDYICPDTFEFKSDYFKMGDRYGRVLYLKEYAVELILVPNTTTLTEKDKVQVSSDDIENFINSKTAFVSVNELPKVEDQVKEDTDKKDNDTKTNR